MANSKLPLECKKVTNSEAVGYKLLVIEFQDKQINNALFNVIVQCKNSVYRGNVILDNGTCIYYCDFPITISNGTVTAGTGSKAGIVGAVQPRDSYSAPQIVSIHGIK